MPTAVRTSNPSGKADPKEKACKKCVGFKLMWRDPSDRPHIYMRVKLGFA
jgi:hypothetical protein